MVFVKKNRVKDTDFLHISPRIKMMEMRLLTREDINRMITAMSDDDAVRVATDRGYTPFTCDLSSLEVALEQERIKLLELLTPHVPNTYMLDFFRIKYDYHNIKSILKAEAMGTDFRTMLSACGTVAAEAMVEYIQHIHEEDMGGQGVFTAQMPVIPEDMASAIDEAQEILARTKDPQLCDICLDRAMFKSLLDVAQKSGTDFLTGYLRLMIDGENLKTFVRIKRMKKPDEFLEKVVFEGGNIPKDSILTSQNPILLYKDTELSQGAKLAEAVVNENSLFAPLDLAIDNSLMEYVRTARFISFGDKTVLAYILAKEGEMNQIRSVIIGRNANRSVDKIRESLRLSYV